MRKAIATIWLLVLMAQVVFGYDPPTLVCLRLTSATQLHVEWSNTTDCGNFNAYDIYVNGTFIESYTASSPYTLCNYSGRDITVTPASSYSCHIIARDTNGGSWQSNTLQMPNLTVTVSPDSSRIFLSWDSPSSSALDSTWGSSFFIFKRHYYENAFPIQPFATVPNTVLTYTDTADVCYNQVSYRVDITNRYPMGNSLIGTCPFSTSIGSAIVVDRSKPNPPVLDSVSVNEQNQPVLGFHATDSAMMGYIIYSNDYGPWEPLDTVYNSTSWTDNNDAERCYRIAVMDSCSNVSDMIGQNIYQCTLNMFVNNLNACQRSAAISWQTYPNLWGGIGEYEIFISTDNGTTYQSVATTTDNNYTLADLTPGTSYRVFVRVHNTDHTISASSNRRDFILESTGALDMTHILSVSVIDNDHIGIHVLTSGDTLDFHEIRLERSDNGTDFTTIATLPYHAAADYNFTDASAEFEKRIYHYRTHVLDHCNSESGFSNVEHNILLQGEATTAQENVLRWISYGDSPSDVDHYSVLRKLEVEPAFNELPDIIAPASLNVFHDDVAALFGGGSKFTYYVTAKLALDEFGFEETSISNQVMVQQLPNTYIPNAFTPSESINNIFLPSNTFVSGEHYSLRIYARTGELIFLTHDPNRGWDGTSKGKPCPIDTYVYKLEYVRPDGTLFERTGTVTLIR